MFYSLSPALVQESLLAASKSYPPDKVYGKLEIETSTGEHIGWVSSYYIDVEKTKLAVGIDIPEVAHSGRGYGRNALALFLSYLFRV